MSMRESLRQAQGTYLVHLEYQGVSGTKLSTLEIDLMKFGERKCQAGE